MSEREVIRPLKAIADYMGLEPRTLKRKAQVRGLPLHRDEDGSYFALRGELIDWVGSQKSEVRSQK